MNFSVMTSAFLGAAFEAAFLGAAAFLAGAAVFGLVAISASLRMGSADRHKLCRFARAVGPAAIGFSSASVLSRRFHHDPRNLRIAQGRLPVTFRLEFLPDTGPAVEHQVIDRTQV